jgi:hypothetical protein
MRLSRWAIAMYVGLVFLSGAVLGAFSHRLYTVSSVSAKSKNLTPDEFRKGLVASMQTRLNLSPDQVMKLNLILDETRAQIREVHEKTQPEIHQIRQAQTDRIRAMLTPDQRQEYEQMRQERDRKLKEKGKGGRPDGPGF